MEPQQNKWDCWNLEQIRTFLCFMLGVGFEPTKASPPDLKSGPFDHSGTPAALRNRTSFSTSRILWSKLTTYVHKTANRLMLYSYGYLLTGSNHVAVFQSIKSNGALFNDVLFNFIFSNFCRIWNRRFIYFTSG